MSVGVNKIKPGEIISMKDYMWAYVGLIVLLLVVAGIILLVRYRKKRIERLGVKGEKMVAKILKPWALLQNYKVINDLYLPLYDKTTQIDHIVIGFFGMIVIETKNMCGEVYGDQKAKEWTYIVGDNKRKLYNPIMQNQAHIDCIRHCLAKENIYNITIDNVVVFANNKVQLYLQKGDGIVIKRKQIKTLLHKSRYEKDRDVDIDRLYHALMKYSVTDKSRIKQHNDGVKEMARNNQK